MVTEWTERGGRYEQIRRRRRSKRVKQTIFVGDNDEKKQTDGRQIDTHTRTETERERQNEVIELCTSSDSRDR